MQKRKAITEIKIVGYLLILAIVLATIAMLMSQFVPFVKQKAFEILKSFADH